MKNIVDILPNEVETILYDLGKEDFITDPETYDHFVNEVFLKKFHEFIENHFKK